MEQISVNNIKIDVIRKGIKNIHLAVYPPIGRVRIAAPLTVNKDAIRLFAVSKLGWIKRSQRKFDGQERLVQREYKQRESHYYQGKRYLLNIIEKEAPPRVVLKSNKQMDLYIRPGTSITKRHGVMNEWYRAELKKQIPLIIDKWAKKLKIKVNEWQIKQMKTKWGSCNSKKKKIWINLELAKKPERCLEYIVLHEMIHLLERKHSDRFLHYLNTHLPSWNKLKAELNILPISHADWHY